MKLYKTHVLSFLKSNTAALYHAAASHLQLVDHVQETFLREVGLTERQAFLHYNLAPLALRRDVAMLGVVHRAVLGKGPPHFFRWFYRAPSRVVATATTRLAARRHNKQLRDFCDGSQTTVLARSALGLVKVYNLLPQDVVNAACVKDLQRALTSWAKAEVEAERPN